MLIEKINPDRKEAWVNPRTWATAKCEDKRHMY